MTFLYRGMPSNSSFSIYSPLLNSLGQLVGVNTAIYSPSGASAGIGFAIPVNTVKEVVPQLISYGRILRPITRCVVAHFSRRRPALRYPRHPGPARIAGRVQPALRLAHRGMHTAEEH